MHKEEFAYRAAKCAYHNDYPALVDLFASRGLSEGEALKSWNNPAAIELRKMGNKGRANGPTA